MGECDAALGLLDAQQRRHLTADTEPLPREGTSGGWRLGRYQVRGGLGAGSMGLVVRAHDPELRRDVALKVLRLKDRENAGETEGGRPVSKARFVHEARTMARLSHENVVEIYDVSTHGELTFIAMELVEGDTLEGWLEKPRTWRQIIDVFTEAGRGLAAAHHAGFVHRDFKPANVLVGTDGRVRVMDFGLATMIREAVAVTIEERSLAADSSFDWLSLTQTGMTVGTPVYMSPEQHLGRPADGRSDQFSFCVALYEALYGVRPFAVRGSQKLARAKQLGRIRTPPPHRRVPQRLFDVIRRGLSAKPRDRFASMEDLLDTLQQAGRAQSPWRKAIATGCTVMALLGAWVGTVPVSEVPADEAMRSSAVAVELPIVRPWREQLLRGRDALAADRLNEAEQRLVDAYFSALAAGDHASASAAAAELAIVLSGDERRGAERRIWEGHAQAARIRAMGTASPH